MGRNQLRYSGFVAKKWARGRGKVINNFSIFEGGLQKFRVNMGEIESQYGRNWGVNMGEIDAQFRPYSEPILAPFLSYFAFF